MYVLFNWICEKVLEYSIFLRVLVQIKCQMAKLCFKKSLVEKCLLMHQNIKTYIDRQVDKRLTSSSKMKRSLSTIGWDQGW